MFHRRLLAAAVLAILGASFVAAVPAVAVNSTVTLPLQNFTDIAEANGKIYLVGSQTTSVVVRDANGGAVTQVDVGSAPVDLAVSDDGSRVYVALSGVDEIAVIDTATDTALTPFSTGTDTCPSTLAVVGTAVWFGYGCSGGSDGIGVVDPTQDPATITLAVVASLNAPPMLAASPAFANRLFAAVELSPTDLIAYDVSGATLTQKASVHITDGLTQMAITSDGQDIVTANGYPYVHPRYKTSDLSRDGQYATNAYPNAVATGQNGLVAAGINGYYDPDVYVYDASRSLIRNYDFGSCCNAGDSVLLAPRGLVFMGSVLYAVTQDYLGSALKLRILRDAAQYPSQLTLSGPTSSKRAAPLSIAGTLRSHGSGLASASLHITKSDLDGKHTLSSLVTSGSGAFTIHDTPRVGGTNTYTVTFAGNATHAAVTKSFKVAVSRYATALSVKPNRSIYNYGATESVTVHLGGTFNAKLRTVSIYAKQAGGTRKLLKTGHVNSSGNLSASVSYNHNVTFTATYGGDEHYAPRTVSVIRKVRVKVNSAIAGWYGKSNGYYLFHASKVGGLGTKVFPNKQYENVLVRMQAKRSGSWQTVYKFSIELNQYSVGGGWFHGASYTEIRLRVEFRGDHSNAANNGKWWYVQFR